MLRSLRLLSTLGCLCSLPAQLPPGARTFETGEKILPWPSTLGGGWVRRVVPLFWANNDHLAAVGLRGTAAGLAVAPGVSSIVIPLDLTTIAADAVELRLSGGPGTSVHDALLFSGAVTGVDLCIAWCGANGVPQVVHYTEPDWWRSTNLITRNDGDYIDIIGKSFSGTTLLRTRYDTLQGTFTAAPSVTMPAAIRDVDLVDFDSGTGPDVAMLTDSELRIVDIAGNTLFSLPLALPGGAIAAVPQAAQRNSIALLRRRASPAGWELVHISQAAVEAPQPVTLFGENFMFGNLVAGDFDGDSDHDLAILNDGNAMRIVRNHGAQPHFDGADAVAPLTVGSTGCVQGAAVGRDFDHDGADDVLLSYVASDGSSKLALLHGTRSWIDPLAETYESIFDDFAHEVEGGDALYIRVLPDVMLDFDRMLITGYIATEAVVASGDPVPVHFERTVTAAEFAELGGSIRQPLAGVAIDYPGLFFLKVQLANDGGVLRPSFLTAGTIDHDEWGEPPTSATSTHLSANKVDGAPDQEVTRYQPTGRKRVGLHVPQKLLPIR